MASWRAIEAEAPELAATARAFFDAPVHKTIATLRRDGSPRISGTECKFAQGELWIGSMWRSMKALDLQRDPRFALHSGSKDPPGWNGDAKVAGRMEEITDPARMKSVYGDQVEPGKSHMFRAEVDELVIVRLNETRDQLVIESWHAGRGVTRQERA